MVPPAPAPAVCAVAAAMLLGSTFALSGCVEEVSLGTQCLDPNCGSNGSPTHPETPGAPLVALDAGEYIPPVVYPIDPVELPDGSLITPDAGGVTAVPQFDGGPRGILPTLRNDSFELTRGSPGALAYSPISPLPLGVNVADPWSACGFGNSVLTNSDSMWGSGKGDVTPTNGPGFVEANIGVPGFQGIRQDLDEPMKGGVRYSLMIDVRAAVGANTTLEFWASNIDCVGSAKLADVGRVPEYWESVCVSFVPQSDVPELYLQPALLGASDDPRIFFDNIRADPRCP